MKDRADRTQEKKEPNHRVQVRLCLSAFDYAWCDGLIQAFYKCARSAFTQHNVYYLHLFYTYLSGMV